MKSKLIILSIATLLGCVSCNTIGGVGKDVEAVGSDINSAARSTSRAMGEGYVETLDESRFIRADEAAFR